MPCEQCENGKYKWGKTGSCKYDTKADCESDNKDYYEDMKETKIVELIIADDSQELAIDAISLVTAPAIEQDFVFFGKEKNNLTFAKVDEEKRMLVSPALIPGKTIFRHDPQTSSDYFVFFSKATVRKASELYLKHNNHHKATYQHQDRISGILTVESWIIEDSKLDKSTLYGFSLPVGTWMVKLKIDNSEIWSKIKDGELKGLSIEGYFTNKFEQMNKTKETTTEEILSAFNELVREGKVNNMSLGKKLELAKRFELADIKTLDKLSGQVYPIYDSMPTRAEIENAIDLQFDEQRDLEVAEDDLKESKEFAEDAAREIDFYQDELKGIQPRIKEEKANLKDANQEIKMHNNSIKAAIKAKAAADKKAIAIVKTANTQVDKAKKLSSALEKALNDFEKAAKALGVNVSGKINEYDTALKDIDEVAGFKVPKIK